MKLLISILVSCLVVSFTVAKSSEEFDADSLLAELKAILEPSMAILDDTLTDLTEATNKANIEIQSATKSTNKQLPLAVKTGINDVMQSMTTLATQTVTSVQKPLSGIFDNILNIFGDKIKNGANDISKLKECADLAGKEVETGKELMGTLIQCLVNPAEDIFKFNKKISDSIKDDINMVKALPSNVVNCIKKSLNLAGLIQGPTCVAGLLAKMATQTAKNAVSTATLVTQAMVNVAKVIPKGVSCISTEVKEAEQLFSELGITKEKCQIKV